MTHESWISWTNIDDDQNWACRITEYWTEKKKKRIDLEWAGFTLDSLTQIIKKTDKPNQKILKDFKLDYKT